MPFGDFKYPAVLADLGLTERTADLFAAVPPLPPGPIAQGVARVGARLAALAHTEKARSEWIVAPLLADLWDRTGERLNVQSGLDMALDPEAGLTGVIDFLIGRTLPHVFRATAPLAVLFEAKRDSIPDGFGQCMAAVVGAQRYNRRLGAEVDPVWGCVTTGTNWRFMRLSGTDLTVDLAEYTVGQLDKLVGILTYIAGPLPPAPTI